MLSFSDRQQKFEQLRAHWEAADTGESIRMMGRRVKPAPQDGIRDNIQQNPGNKFRRKLSNGLALISLTQRKAVAGRQDSTNVSLAVSAPCTNGSSTAVLYGDTSLPPHGGVISVAASSDLPLQESARASEDLQTPQALPRSRTFSYIPRPAKLDTESSPAAERDGPIDASLFTVMTNAKPAPPSRKPTPTPPQSKRRVSNSRQYASLNQPLQAKGAENRQCSTIVVNDSPSKGAVRSRTAANLLKRSTTQSASFMASRRSGHKQTFASSALLKPALTENMPTSKRVAQRQSQIQEKLTKRESMAVPSLAAKRRSLGPAILTAQNKCASLAPSESAKRLSAHLVQTPVTAKRVSTRPPHSLRKPPSPCPSEETPLTNVPGQTSANSSAPTLSTVDLLDLPLAPPPKIRTVTDNDAQRRALGTPSGMAGVWRSSKVFDAANHQVRRLPRSSTFHHFGRRPEAPPTVPPILDYYKLPSFPNLVSSIAEEDLATERPNLRHRLPMTWGMQGSSRNSMLSNKALTQVSQETVSIQSMPTFVSATIFEVPEDVYKEGFTNQVSPLYRFEDEVTGRSIQLNNAQLESSSILFNDTTALPSLQANPDLKSVVRRSTSSLFSETLTGVLSKHRRWSISHHFYPNSANGNACLQVKDYMPLLYWAGRFQSRFDRWRTEAMTAQLDPEFEPEDDRPLGQCSIEDEKKAIILIFMQLRDLCASAQAADSLHEFEYKYRRDHKLLDTKLDLPPSIRKLDESTAEGPIGRAVRKLTPRKASFANLFKGKSWNRADATKSEGVSGHVRELQDISFVYEGRETDDLGSYDSAVQLHSR